MYRRRRRTRDIPFSFDSFLDVVANVCGIIIRLILVAWVGARSYHLVAAQRALETPPEPAPAVQHVGLEPREIKDPLELDLLRQRRELEQHEQRLLDQLRQYQHLRSGNVQASAELTELTATQAALEGERGQLEQTTSRQNAATQTVQLSLSELKQRSSQLAAELRELEK